MKKIENKLQQILDEKHQRQNFRQLILVEGLIDFTSNDYLGLARSSILKQNIQRTYRSLPEVKNGSTGSRLLSGNSKLAFEIENYLAKVFVAEKSLIYNSGYNANLAILSSVPGKGDTIIYDALIHSSLKDGARLSLAKKYPFKHNDLDDLKNKLEKSEGNKFVVIEAIYSMDGDFAPLQEIVTICKEYEAALIVDEAHSTGVIGEQGNGLTCKEHLEEQVFARIYTFGKAMGTHGACIAGSENLITYLINFSRSFIYTTALPDHALLSIKCAFEYLQANLHLQDLLKQNITHYQNLIKDHLSSDLMSGTETAIQVIKVSGNEQAVEMASKVRQRGFDVRPILSPTVREGEERIRICLHVHNTKKEIEGLIKAIAS